jgi:hypothetical protein
VLHDVEEKRLSLETQFYPTEREDNPRPSELHFNPLTPNDLLKTSRSKPFKIKIPSKNMREKPTNTQVIHSVY